MNINTNKKELKKAFEQMMAEFDTKYHLTITFPVNTSDKVCNQLLNQIINHLNRRIYVKRYTRGESFIQGFVIQEITYGMNTKHYHMIIGDESGYLPDFDRMDKLLESQIKYLGNDSALVRKEYELEEGKNSVKCQLIETEFKKKKRKIRSPLLRLRRRESDEPSEVETQTEPKQRFIDCYQLQEYYNDGDNGLEKYLTKNFNRTSQSVWDAINSIGLLGPGDLDFNLAK